jgi:hypothetical protein
MRIVGFFLFFLAVLAGTLEAKAQLRPINTPVYATQNTSYKQPPPSKFAKDPEQDLPLPTQTFVVDDFHDATLKAWWGFGDLFFNVVENGAGQLDPTIQGRSVRFEGSTKEWVVGGCGRALGVSASQFNALKLVIKGNKLKKSGIMTIELFVDNDGKWRDRDPQRREFLLRNRYKFIYTLPVDWSGWKVVTIPFKDFLPDTPQVTQILWDRGTQKAVGSLIQLQFVMFSPEKSGFIDFQIDSISLVNDPNPVVREGLLDF